MTLNRKGKTVRNLALCVLLGVLLHALMGFPPCTVRAMCRQFQASRLLAGEIEPLHVRHERYGYSGDWVYRVRTFIVAKSGETYASFLYSRNLLQNEIDYHYTPKIEQNALCAAWNGTIYATGPFAEADSAILEIKAELRNRDKVLKSKTFTIAGERLENEVFGFPYSLDMLGGGLSGWAPEDLPDELSLYNIARLWYGDYWDEDGGHGIRHADLPCVLTLYDGSGRELERYDLSIDNYEIFFN
ncbi:hypothetical protein [Oscillibacter sp. 1-3]|uniref:hypothetical protein n=1 Tax=Oscillibacter sp. 1-3 TaxID=1235797 RepID=UPI000337A8F1|nr:hypothetical protein [Oscillibacter sp. 1-3]EOS67275.1 hypothetical protein C816_00307 [Oscillibacter sp. 1-3]